MISFSTKGICPKTIYIKVENRRLPLLILKTAGEHENDRKVLG